MQVPRHLAGAQQGGLGSRTGGPFPHDSMGQNRRTCIGRLLRSQLGSCIGCAIASERAEIASGTARLTKTNDGRSVPWTAHSFDDGSREFVGLRRVVRIDREDGEERLNEGEPSHVEGAANLPTLKCRKPGALGTDIRA